MQPSHFKKIKHGHVPGDIGKRGKIAMREKPSKSRRAKSFNDRVRSRTKAVLKERARREVAAQQE